MNSTAEQLSLELEASLLRALQRSWRQINHNFFRDALKPVVFCLVNNRSILGRWSRKARAIEMQHAACEHVISQLMCVFVYVFCFKYIRPRPPLPAAAAAAAAALRQN